jgi:hypothetical protein
MKIGNYIFELLHHHDCVIVPDLGGFVTRYQHAAIHPVQHEFTPPSKSVAFNGELIKNDGLLANYISQRLLLSYVDSCRLIQDFVSLCKNQLENNQRIVIEGIGELFYDPEKNIQFRPSGNENYLLDSFGLGTVQSPAIQRDRPFEIFNNKDASVLPAPQQKFTSKFLIKTILGISAAAMVAFAYFNPFLSSKISKGLALIIPVNDQQHVVTSTPADVEAESKIQYENSLTASETNAQNVETNIYEHSDNDPAIKSESEKPVTTVESSEPVSVSQPKEEVITPKATIVQPGKSGPYFIIGGCFSIYDNALKLQAELIQKGFSSQLVGKNKNGLEMVAIASASNIAETETLLSEARSAGYADAWVFKKK